MKTISYFTSNKGEQQKKNTMQQQKTGSPLQLLGYETSSTEKAPESEGGQEAVDAILLMILLAEVATEEAAV